MISLKDKIKNKARKKIILGFLIFFVLIGAVVVFLNRPAVSAASSQIKNPGTVATSSAVGTINWSGPANAKTADSIYASSSITYNATTYYLLATNFGFNIPTGSTINGISARVKRYNNSGVTTYIKDAYVRLIKGGVVQTVTNKASATGWPTSNAYSATYGGAADLWSGTWTAADINASNFGIAIAAKNTKTTSGTYIAYVDHIELTVSYTLPVPNVPTLVSPSNAASGVGLLPTLEFAYSDPNNYSASQFNIQIDDNSDFSSPVASTTVSGSWASSSTISYEVDSPLSGGTKYYWRVMVYNGYSWSAWSGGTGLNLGNIKNISTGNNGNNFAVSNSGNLYCWGENMDGQLGIGNTTDQLIPTKVKGEGGSGYLTGVRQVAAASYHACALKTDGTVWCWGYNTYGQLGINNTTDQTYPVQVKGPGGLNYLTGVIQIEAGSDSVCALKSDDTVWCWGSSSYNQLGIGTTTNQLTPARVKGEGGSGYLAGVSQLSLAAFHSCALKTDGTVYCWGDNSTGQLGISSTTTQAYPTKVKGEGGSGYISNVNYVATGGESGLLSGSTCAVKTDGTAWCWGYSDPMWQLGIGNVYSQLTPAQVFGVDGSGYFTGASQMAPQVYHSCAAKTDGTAYCVGENDDGELGINNKTDKIYLTQVTGVGGSGFITGVIQISPSEGLYNANDYGCALKTDGTVFCWGGNNSGQLGINNTTQKNAPVQVLKGAATSPDVDGPWNFTTISNKSPYVPALIAPANGLTGVNATPTLQFIYRDPDGDNCTKFDLQIDDDSDFSSPVASSTITGSWSSSSTINYTVASALTPGTKYYWRARAYDGTDWSDWSGGLTDNFDNNLIDAEKWETYTEGAGTAAESGGKIVITVPSGAISWQEISSVNVYDLSGASASVNVLQIASSTSMETMLYLKSGANNALILKADPDSGAIIADKIVSGVETEIANAVYNSNTMAWWRIREAAGTTYWEYSADGLAWTVLTSAANPIAVTSLRAYLVGRSWKTAASSQAAWFDNFNIVPTSVLGDNFNDNSIDGAKWIEYTDGGSVAETSQQLQITSGTGQWNENGIVSGAQYDLTDSQVSVQLVDGAGGNTDGLSFTVTPLELYIDEDNRAYIYLDNGWLGCNIVQGGSWGDLGGLDYDPNLHKYLRFYNYGGTISWAWSTDGITWNDVGSATPSWAVTNLSIRIWNMPENTGTTAVQLCKFDNFNLVVLEKVIDPWSFTTKPATNQAPSITSLSIDTSDTTTTCRAEPPLTVCRSGATTTFASTASDPDDDLMKLFVCKDFLCSNCGPGNTSNCWAASSAGAAANPSAAYDSSSRLGAPGEYTTTSLKAYGKVCDINNVCSGVYGVTPPSVAWINTFGNADVYEDSFAIQQTSDGGYAVVGSTNYTGEDSFLISKIDFSGNTAWTKSIPGSGGNADGNSLYQTLDGGYIVGGDSHSLTDTNILLVKLNSNASSIAWAETIGGTATDTLDTIQQNPDGTYILAGTTESFVSGQEQNIFVAKLNSDGSRVWAKVIGGSSYEGAHSIQRVAGGGYILAGETCSFGIDCDIYVMKLTEDGSVSWSKTIGTSGDEYGFSIQQTSDGGYVVAGGTDAYGAGDVFVAKLTSVGSVSWFKTFGGAGLDQGFTVRQTLPDGGYIVVGSTDSLGSVDIFAVKLTNAGAISWSKVIGTAGNDYPGSLNSVQQTLDGGYIISGYTNGYDTGDALLVKLDSSGNSSGCLLASSVSLTPVTRALSAVSFTPTVNSSVVPTISVKSLSINPIYLGEYDRCH